MYAIWDDSRHALRLLLGVTARVAADSSTQATVSKQAASE